MKFSSITKTLLFFLAASSVAVSARHASAQDVSVQESGKQAERVSQRNLELTITGPDQLRQDGWVEVEPDVWRLTSKDGSVQEIAFGRRAEEQILARIDAEFADLLRLESPSDGHLRRMEELEARREKALASSDGSTDKASGSVIEPMCAGGAHFGYSFYTTYDGSGYLTYNAGSSASYTASLFYGGNYESYAQARVCVFGSCQSGEDKDSSSYPGSPLATAHASKASGTTTLCWGTAYGEVIIDPHYSGCKNMATHTMNMPCSSF